MCLARKEGVNDFEFKPDETAKGYFHNWYVEFDMMC
jgi:hypothetical protein